MGIPQRKDIGIAGTLIVISQGLLALHSTQGLEAKIDKLGRDLLEMRVEREHFFARKTDLFPIYDKLDRMNEQMNKIHDSVISLKAFVKENFGFETSAIIGCDLPDFSKEESSTIKI